MHFLSSNDYQTADHCFICWTIWKCIFVANTLSLQVVENFPQEEGLSTKPCTFDSKCKSPDNLSEIDSCPGIEAISNFFLFLFVFLLFCCLSYDPLIIWIVCFACLYFILFSKICMFMIDAIYLIFFPPGKLKSHFREGYNVVIASGYGLLGWRGFDSYE